MCLAVQFHLSVSFHGKMFDNTISIVKTDKPQLVKNSPQLRMMFCSTHLKLPAFFNYLKILKSREHYSKATVEALHTDTGASMLYIHNKIFI